MKAVSVLALLSALTIIPTNAAFAQASVGGTVSGSAGAETTTENGGVDVGVDADVDVGVDVGVGSDDDSASGPDDDDSGSTAGSDASGDAEVDEDAAVDGGADVDSGTDDPAAGSDQDDTGSDDMGAAVGMTIDDCSDVMLESIFTGLGDEARLSVIASATNAQVIVFDECVEDDNAGQTADLEAAIFANQDLAALLATQGVDPGTIIGADTTNGSVTIFAIE